MKDDFWNEFLLKIAMFRDQPYDEMQEEKKCLSDFKFRFL